MRVYISGALQGARDIVGARHKYELLAVALAAKGFDVYLPHKQTDPVLAAAFTPEEVYAHDIAELEKSDVLVAFLDEPSLGVGAEIVIALHRGKEVIGIIPEYCKTSRFITGLLKAHQFASILEYEKLEDAANFIYQVLRPGVKVGW